MICVADRLSRPGTFVFTVSPLGEADGAVTSLICHAFEVGPGGMPESAYMAAVCPGAPGLSKADLLGRNDRVNLPDIFADFPSSAIRYILNAIPYGIVIIDMNKRIRFINEMALELSGYRSNDDLLGRICHRLLCPTEMDHCPILDFGMSFDRTERKLLTESGIEIPVLKTGLRINLGGEDLLLETFIDLRNTKELAAAYQRSEERYQTIFENTGSGMLIYDETGTILLANKEMQQITGRNGAFFQDRPSVFSLVSPEDGDMFREEHARLISKTNVNRASAETEFRMIALDGSHHHIHATIVVIPCTSISVASLIDITSLRNTEVALVLANKKLKTLSSITRHDISNQLTALLLILELVQSQIDEPIGIEGEEDLLGRGVSLIHSIQSQIDFASEYESVGVEKPLWLNLFDVARGVAADAAFSGIRFQCAIPPMLSVFCDAMITKVCYNLFENAVRHGGSVTEISLSFVEKKDTGVFTIRDNGDGVPDGKKSSIFAEGFGEHTGFGLFLIQSILEITGLSIQETGVYTEGAVFEITIPKGSYRFDEEDLCQK